jgi:hypothetical protein
MHRSDFNDAADGLVADLRAGQDDEPVSFDPEAPHDYEDDEHATLTLQDDDGTQYDVTTEQAGELVTALGHQWDELSPEEQHFTAALAHELREIQREHTELEHGVEVLHRIVADLDERGYSVEDFARVLNETDDLGMALHAIEEIGPTPRNLDAALDQTLHYQRRNREAEHSDGY